MKAIYINLDDALRAVLVGETPPQPQVPLAVTIPAGQSAAVYAQTGTAAKTSDAGSAVTFVDWSFSPSLGDAIAQNVAPGMSQVLASETADVYAVSGDGFTATATIKNNGTTVGTFSVQVVVNRETLDGPVDLVDFTLPAVAPSAADIKSALVEAGAGALEGVSLDGMNLSEDGTIHGFIDGSPASMALTVLGDGEIVDGFIGWSTTTSD
jgi:hypothetical protein